MAGALSHDSGAVEDHAIELDEAEAEAGVEEALARGQGMSSIMAAKPNDWKPDSQEEEQLEKQWSQLTKQFLRALVEAPDNKDTRSRGGGGGGASDLLTTPSKAAVRSIGRGSMNGLEVDEDRPVKPMLLRSKNFFEQEKEEEEKERWESVPFPDLSAFCSQSETSCSLNTGCDRGTWRFACVHREGLKVFSEPAGYAIVGSIRSGSLVTACERGKFPPEAIANVVWLRLSDGSGWILEDEERLQRVVEPPESKVGKCCLIHPEIYRYVALTEDLGVVPGNVFAVDRSKPLIEPGGPVVVKEHVTMTLQVPPFGKRKVPTMEPVTFAYVENLDPDGKQAGWVFDHIELGSAASVLVDVETLEAEAGSKGLILKQCLTTFSPGRGPDKPGRRFTSKTLKPGEMHTVQEWLSTCDSTGVSRKWYRLAGLGWVGAFAGKGEPVIDIVVPEPAYEVWVCKDVKGGALYDTPSFEKSVKKKVKLKGRQRVVVDEKATPPHSGILWLHTKFGWVPQCDAKGNQKMTLLQQAANKGPQKASARSRCCHQAVGGLAAPQEDPQADGVDLHRHQRQAGVPLVDHQAAMVGVVVGAARLQIRHHLGGVARHRILHHLVGEAPLLARLAATDGVVAGAARLQIHRHLAGEVVHNRRGHNSNQAILALPRRLQPAGGSSQAVREQLTFT